MTLCESGGINIISVLIFLLLNMYRYRNMHVLLVADCMCEGHICRRSPGILLSPGVKATELL